MRKTLGILVLFILIISLISPLSLAQETTEPTITEETSTGRQPLRPRIIRKKIIPTLKVKIEERKEKNKQNIMDKIKNGLGRVLHFAARGTGELTAINGNTLTIKNESGNTYQINVTDKTTIVRRYGGKSDLSEFAVGNMINVVGKWTDENKTAIDAKLIRDISIQKRHGVVFGKVTTKSDSSFTIETKRNEETFTVTIYTSGATFINRKEETIAYSDVLVGHMIRAKGVWDKSLKEMRETTKVKDFILPIVIPTQATQN